jgi:hypothetical protein
VFAYAMLLLSASGAAIVILRAQPFNIAAGLFTFYLVTTAWITVRCPAADARWLDAGALLLALARLRLNNTHTMTRRLTHAP